MITGIIQFFYPDIKREEVKKFGLLAIALFFILGTYWILRLLKDVMIYQLAFPVELWGKGYGASIIPNLKVASIVTISIVSIIYAKLIDSFKKHQLFYIIISFFIAAFSVITAMVFAMNTWGVAAIGKMPLAITGIVGYLITESYGSLVIALFWSFTVSSSTSDQAKRCFPLIMTIAQIGTILGSGLVSQGINISLLFFICLFSLASVLVTMRYFVANVPAEAEIKGEKKSKPDVLAGFKLIFTQPYLGGVLIVSTFYEIAKTVVDYQMKSQASIIPGVNFQVFVGKFGTYVNVLTFVISLLGTAKLIKQFGLRFCLLFSPIVYGGSLIGLYLYYQSSPEPIALLNITMYVMIVLTAISYAVNNPTKEMMYIPTSKDAKFKAKGLIDMFGSRSAKGTGAAVGGALNVKGDALMSIANLMTYGTLFSVGIVAAWMVAAIFVGLKNSQLIKDGEIIE
jgi:AAA family ATP:ADP antiporter